MSQSTPWISGRWAGLALVSLVPLVVLLDRLVVAVLHGMVGSAMLAPGPEAAAAALLGAGCLGVHLAVMVLLPALLPWMPWTVLARLRP